MAKTLMEVRQKIAELKALEDQLRKNEAKGVISRIREAIAVYGFTERDLFGSPTKPNRGKASERGSVSEAKYSDPAGNTWSGRGPRPKWLRVALENGSSLDQFAAATPEAAKLAKDLRAGRGSGKPVKSGDAQGKKVAAKYRDGANTWSGRGSQPRWLRESIASGKSIEDFAV